MEASEATGDISHRCRKLCLGTVHLPPPCESHKNIHRPLQTRPVAPSTSCRHCALPCAPQDGLKQSCALEGAFPRVCGSAEKPVRCSGDDAAGGRLRAGPHTRAQCRQPQPRTAAQAAGRAGRTEPTARGDCHTHEGCPVYKSRTPTRPAPTPGARDKGTNPRQSSLGTAREEPRSARERGHRARALLPW
jgi:hypothetical protein